MVYNIQLTAIMSHSLVCTKDRIAFNCYVYESIKATQVNPFLQGAYRRIIPRKRKRICFYRKG